MSDEESHILNFFVIPDLIRNLVFCFSIGVSREMCSLDLTDPLGVMHLKEKSAKYAQGDGKEIGVSREMCSLDIQTLSKYTLG